MSIEIQEIAEPSTLNKQILFTFSDIESIFWWAFKLFRRLLYNAQQSWCPPLNHLSCKTNSMLYHHHNLQHMVYLIFEMTILRLRAGALEGGSYWLDPWSSLLTTISYDWLSCRYISYTEKKWMNWGIFARSQGLFGQLVMQLMPLAVGPAAAII